MKRLAHFTAVSILLSLSACAESAPPESPKSPAGSEPVAATEAPKTATVAPAKDDPLHGQFTLADATAGLAGDGPLTATIKTSMGEIACTLDDVHAPITVANFVGLARGTRPWKTPEGTWEKKPAYENSTFHRVIEGFMIQGGDPTGTGTGDPGYKIPDESWSGATHDRAGLLCMANKGPNTNGMQFFITDARAANLDHAKTTYTIFGSCSPTDVVHAIATTPTGAANRPNTPVTIEHVTITRAPH